MITAPAVQIHEERVGSTTVLRLVGPVNDAGTMVRLAQDLVAARLPGGHVVLDLDGLTVEEPAALCALVARLSACNDGIPIPTVVTDPGTRRLLRACGSSAAGLACFPSREEASLVARPAPERLAAP